MKNFAHRIAAAAVVTSCVVAATPALADNNECKDAQDQLNETSVAVFQACEAWNKNNKKTVDCEKLAATAADIAGIVKSIAGVLGIGSKRFEFNSEVTGNIIGVTKRMWVSATPATNATTTVKVTHRDGKGKVKINICAASYDPDGKATATLISSRVIEGSDSFTVPSSTGKNLSVEIVGREATRSFAYNLKVTN